jgi:hypothetical protein
MPDTPVGNSGITVVVERIIKPLDEVIVFLTNVGIVLGQIARIGIVDMESVDLFFAGNGGRLRGGR